MKFLNRPPADKPRSANQVPKRFRWGAAARTSSLLANDTSPNVAAPRHLRGWTKSTEKVVTEYLEPRGSSLEDFKSAGCEVLSDASTLDPIFPPGPAAIFKFYDPISGAPYLYQDQDGNSQAFYRIKPLGNRHDRRAKFLQPRDSGTHVYFAPATDWPTILDDPSHDLIATEGETRSLAGAALGLVVVSITGVDCGQQDGNLHPDLMRASWKGRRVFFAFDSDVRDKDEPRKALRKLAMLLRIQGAQVFEVKIPPMPDGSKQGLDDFLAHHGRETFEALVASAETHLMEGAGEYEPPTLLADLMATTYPPTEWVWQDFILKGEVNLLSGDGGVGKSLLALHLALAVADGKPLFGGTTIQMPVIGLFAEDGPAQVQQRSRTIMRDHTFGSDLPIKLWCQPRGETTLAQIDDNGLVKELSRLHALRAELSDLHSQGFTAFIVLDSLADLFAMNESLRLPVNAALKQVLGGLCRDFDATVLVLMHPSKASMQDGTHYSGSTAFNNAVRQRLTLEIVPREKGDTSEGQSPRILKVAKSNYGPLIDRTLWYCGATISDRSLETPTSAAAGEQLARACVWAAVDAAQRGVPFTSQRAIPEPALNKIAELIGRRPRQSEVKRELEAAVHAEPQLLTYLTGTNTTRAGFYPVDMDMAKALSRRPKKQGLRRKDGKL